MKQNCFITLSLFCILLFAVSRTPVFSNNVLIKKVESIKDDIFQEILSQMNITDEVISKDEYSNIYKIFKNKTYVHKHHDCDKKLKTLKFINNTHTCYVLGDYNNKIINELSSLIYRESNFTGKIYFEDLYKYENITEIIDIPEIIEIENPKNSASELLNQVEFRVLANFHELNQNEINYRRKYPRRRYIDESELEKKLSRKERKKRKKKLKKLKKKQDKLRKKRKKNKSVLEQVKSTVKWMACVEISLAICSCCLTLIQAIVLPYVSPVPIGARVQPINTMFSRGYEDYGNYNGFSLNNGLPLNNGFNNMNTNNNNYNTNLWNLPFLRRN